MTEGDDLRGHGRTVAKADIGRAAISGGRWLPTAQLVNQASRIITSLVLAWFLTSEEFGLVAVAMVVMALVERLADLGTGQAVIQRKVLDDRLADSIFVLNTLIGLGLGLAIIALAGPLSFLAGGDEGRGADGLIRLLGINVIIRSVGVVQFALLRRRLEFRKAGLTLIAGATVYLLVSVVLAVRGAGAWALVIGSTSASAVSVILGAIWSSWLPRWRFDRQAIRSVTGFGLGLTASNLLTYATQNVDRSLIAHNLGIGPLGVYALGVRVLRAPIVLITMSVNQVQTPILARLQDDRAAQRARFLQVSETAALVIFPAMLGLTVLADPLVDVALPARWRDTAPLIEVMAPVGMMRALSGLVSPIYIANARIGRQLLWNLLFGTMLITSYVITSTISIMAVVVGIGIVHVIGLPFFFVASFRIIDLSLLRYLRSIGPATILAVITAAAVLGCRLFLESQGASALATLATGVAVGVVVITVLVLILRPPGFVPLMRLLGAQGPWLPQGAGP